MATIVTKHGRLEVPDNDLRIQAYRALRIAAERMGRANYKHKGKLRHNITGAHAEIVAAMPMVLDGTLDPEAAMNLLARGDVLEQRLA